MRELTTAQEDLLLGERFAVHTKLEVQTSTSTGAYTDLSQYFVAATVDEDIDQPIAEARIEIRRAVSSSANLSPLSSNSTFAQDSCNAPWVDINREVKLSVATIAASCSPGSTDYDLIFRGDIDAVAWQHDPMELRCRDHGADLQDQWVEDGRLHEYSTSSTSGLHQVVQDILDDWTTPAPTLLVHPTTPTFIFDEGPFIIGDTRPVLDVCRELVDQIGYDFRYYWSSSGADYQLTLRDPDRDSTAAPASTFGADRYNDVTMLEIDRTLVRNVVQVSYYDLDVSTEAQTVTAENTSSQDRFGRRWMLITESTDSQINSSGEALTFAQALVDDLAFPIAGQEVDMDLWWPVQIGDAYRWKGNDVHYSTDQDLAVTGFRHELAAERHRTLMRVRGSPAGGYLRWRRPPKTPPRFGGFTFWTWLVSNDISLVIAASDILVDGAFFELSSGSTFVEPTSSSTSAVFVSRAQFPYNEAQGLEVQSTDTYYLWLKFWNQNLGFGMEAKWTVALPPGSAKLLSADCDVGDDGADVTYFFSWEPDIGVTDAAHDVLCEAAHSTGTFPEVSSSEASPKTNTTKNLLDGGAGDGIHQSHDWEVNLLNSTGGTLQTISGTTVSSDAV
jgi:hypothetical protein